MLDVGKFGALLVENVDRRFLARAQANSLASTPGCLILENAEGRKAGRGRSPHQTRTFAMRAWLRRCFKHAGSEPLPAHLHQAEAGDAADLDARAVVLQGLLHGLLDLP